MNLIILGFDTFISSVAEDIIKYLNPSVTYWITPTKKKEIKNVEFIDWYSAKSDNFSNTVNSNFKIDLDLDLIDKFNYLENDYNKMIFRSNRKVSIDEIRSHYYYQLLYWANFIESKKIDSLIFSNVPHEGFDFLIYSVAKSKNLKVIILYSMPIIPKKTLITYWMDDINSGNRFFFDDLDTLRTSNKDISNDDLRKDILEYIFAYRKSNFKGYTRDNSNNWLMYYTRKIFYFKKSVQNLKERERSSNLSFSVLISQFINGIIKGLILDWYSRRTLKEYLRFTSEIDLKIDYVYFPLNYQPEASTAPLAHRFSDLYLVVKALDTVLPSECLIYIKEHPRISKNRNKNYYQIFQNISRVRFVNPSFNSRDLIINSKAVAITTGSAGLEAIVNKIPVIMFGSRIYKYANGVFQFTNNDEMRINIQTIFNTNYKINEQDIYQFLYVLGKYSSECYVSPKDKVNSYFTDQDNKLNLYNLLLSAIETSGFRV